MINNPTNKPEIPKIETIKPNAAIVGSIALSGEMLPASVVEEYMPGFKGEETHEALPILDSKAMLIIDAEITGAWHYSPDRIEKFPERELKRLKVSSELESILVLVN